MKKTNNYTFTLLLLVCLSILLLGIGYAQIVPEELDVEGTVTADSQTGLVISGVTYVSGNTSSNINTYYQNMLDSSIILSNDIASTMVYNISFINLTNEDYIYEGVTFDSSFYSNDEIEFDVTGLNINDTVLANQSVQATITFKYAGSNTTNNTLDSILNFKFRRANAVYVHFDTNGGTAVNTLELDIGDQIGTLPEPTKVICPSPGPGTYHDRGCTFVGELVGWYLEPNFVTPVTPTYTVTQDTTIYAKWHSEYENYTHIPLIAFNGVDEFLDTGINLYSEDNLNKDFDITFDIVDIDYSYQASGAQQQPTIMNSKDESQNTYPGFVLRFNTNNSNAIYSVYRWNSLNSNKQFSSTTLPIHITYKRRNGVVTFSAATDNTTYYNDLQLFNQSTWTLTQYHSKNVVFGSSYNSAGVAFRFFKGSLANIEVTAYETT